MEIKGRCVQVEIPGEPAAGFVEVAVPTECVEKMPPFDLVAVVDCSGSMAGKRIRRVNKLLAQLQEAAPLDTVHLIRFGSQAQAPTKIRQKIKPINADLGGTNFHSAFRMWIKLLEKLQEPLDRKVVCMFISDGEASSPTSFFDPLFAELKRLNSIVVPVAVSRQADAPVMIRLAEKHSLVYLDDNSSDEEVLSIFFERAVALLHSPIVFQYTDKQTGQPLATTSVFPTNRDAPLFDALPAGLSLDQVSLSVGGGENLYPVNLELIGVKECVTYACCHCQNYSKTLLGQVVTKKMDKAEALERVLRVKAFVEQLARTAEDEIHATADDSTPEGRTKHRLALKKVRRTFYGVREDVNKTHRAMVDNDHSAAIEIYSGSRVSPKMAMYLAKIAAKNKGAEECSVKREEVEALLQNERECPLCILWMINPYDDIKQQEWDEVDQGEWLGQAAFIDPGKVASVSPWCIKQLIFRPVCIINTAIDSLRKDDANDPKRRARLQGYEVDFNCSLPLFNAGENPDAVKLALTFMRKSTAGLRYISNIITNTSDLHDANMIPAVYGAGCISTLQEGQTDALVWLSFRAFLTLVYFSSTNTLGNCAHTALSLATNDALKVVANKESIPHMNYMLGAMGATAPAYKTSMDAVRKIFLYLFVRALCTGVPSSAKLEEALTSKAKVAEFQKAAFDAAMARTPKPSLELEEPHLKVHTADLRSLAVVYGIHCFVRERFGGRPYNMFDQVLDGRVTEDELVPELKKMRAKYVTDFTPVKLLQELLGCEADVAKTAYWHLGAICCQGHMKEKPHHDTSYIGDVLKTCGEFDVAAFASAFEQLRNRYEGVTYRNLLATEVKQGKKAQRVAAWVAKVKALQAKYPLLLLCNDFEEATLSYSTLDPTDRLTFPSRPAMFTFIYEMSFADKDLDRLLQRKDFSNFIMNDWKTEHVRYAPGFSLYAPAAVQKAASADEFATTMTATLEKHYNGDMGEEFARPCTDSMRCHIADLSKHYFENHQVIELLKKERASLAGKPPAEILPRLEALCPTFRALKPDQQTIRRHQLTEFINKYV